MLEGAGIQESDIVQKNLEEQHWLEMIDSRVIYRMTRKDINSVNCFSQQASLRLKSQVACCHNTQIPTNIHDACAVKVVSIN